MLSFFKKKPKEKDVEAAMAPSIAEDFSDIEPIAEYFKNETGVTFDKQRSILKNKVMTFCKLRGIHSFSELLSSVKKESLLKQELTDYLTTNETFFYREIGQINELVKLVQEKHSHVDILCAPSATGEEPYSIAIALLEAGVSPDRFSIVGIDINSDAVQKANEAIYKERNVRNLSTEIRSRYFTQNEDKYALNQSVKSLINFKLLNLFDDSFKTLGKFDFVFSRNMLIYFDKETKLRAKEILESMRKSSEHPVFFGHADLF